MDYGTLLPAIIEAAPQTAIVGLVIILVCLRERAHSTDKADWREDRKARDDRHSGEMDRLTKARNDEETRLKKQVAELRAENEALEDLVDRERARRRAAEDGEAPTQQFRSVQPPAPPRHYREDLG